MAVLILDAVAVNAVAGWEIYKYFAGKQTTAANTQMVPTSYLSDSKAISDSCGLECQRTIAEKISQLRIELAAAAGPSASPKTTPVPSEKTAPTARVAAPTLKAKTQTITYVAIPGSGSSQKTDWENLAGTEFYFNPADYPGLKDVYFEANIKLFNGNGMAYVRLFDNNHGIGVQGSDAQTNSQSNGIVVSGRVSFWAGNNLIKVQAKTLTADTTVFSSGRLKIIQEN